MNKTLRRILRWSLLWLIPWILFWGVYYLTQGQFPTTNAVCFWNGSIILLNLPFNVSRLADVFAIPLFMATLVMLGQGPAGRAVNCEAGDNDGMAWFAMLSWLGILIGFGIAMLSGVITGIASTLLIVAGIATGFLSGWGIKLFLKGIGKAMGWASE